MKYIVLLVLLCVVIYIFIKKEQKQEKQEITNIAATNIATKDIPIKKKTMHLTDKKKKFIHIVLPSVLKVHKSLEQRYNKISEDIKNKINTKEIQKLKAQYKTQSDEDLLARLKPHPVSIVLAQAAMESSWATSRFAKEANNIFGMWSVNANEPRIAAGEKRDGNRTIWLKKFDTLDDAVKAYYEMISRGKTYKKLRVLRMEYNDPYKITPGLDKYSEMGPAYVDIVNKLIEYNKFTQYDN